MVSSAALSTTAKTRVIAHQQQVVRFDHDGEHAAAPAHLGRRLLTWVTRNVRRFPVVVVSDYGKGVVTPELLAELARLRARHGFAYVLDPKRPNFSHYRGASLVKPNLAEASTAAGIEIDDRHEPRRGRAPAARALAGRRHPHLARRGRHDALQAAVTARSISRPPRRRSTT